MRSRGGYPALHFAVGMDYQEIAKMLLAAGADPNIRNKNEGTGTRDGTPLQSAAFWGRVEIAEMLIDAGADVNARGETGSTPLHNAARLSNKGMVRLLLKNGAEKDALDRSGRSPLDRCRNSEVLQKIFEEHAGK